MTIPPNFPAATNRRSLNSPGGSPTRHPSKKPTIVSKIHEQPNSTSAAPQDPNSIKKKSFIKKHIEQILLFSCAFSITNRQFRKTLFPFILLAATTYYILSQFLNIFKKSNNQYLLNFSSPNNKKKPAPQPLTINLKSIEELISTIDLPKEDLPKSPSKNILKLRDLCNQPNTIHLLVYCIAKKIKTKKCPPLEMEHWRFFYTALQIAHTPKAADQKKQIDELLLYYKDNAKKSQLVSYIILKYLFFFIKDPNAITTYVQNIFTKEDILNIGNINHFIQNIPIHRGEFDDVSDKIKKIIQDKIEKNNQQQILNNLFWTLGKAISTEQIMDCYIAISNTYLFEKNIDSAKKYLKKSLKYITMIYQKDKKPEKNVYEPYIIKLSELAISSGDILLGKEILKIYLQLIKGKDPNLSKPFLPLQLLKLKNLTQSDDSLFRSDEINQQHYSENEINECHKTFKKFTTEFPELLDVQKRHIYFLIKHKIALVIQELDLLEKRHKLHCDLLNQWIASIYMLPIFDPKYYDLFIKRLSYQLSDKKEDLTLKESKALQDKHKQRHFLDKISITNYQPYLSDNHLQLLNYLYENNKLSKQQKIILCYELYKKARKSESRKKLSNIIKEIDEKEKDYLNILTSLIHINNDFYQSSLDNYFLTEINEDINQFINSIKNNIHTYQKDTIQFNLDGLLHIVSFLPDDLEKKHTVSILKFYLKLFPESTRKKAQLKDIYLKKNNPKKALEIIGHDFISPNHHPQEFHEQVDLQIKTGKIEDAIKNISSFLVRNPKELISRKKLISILTPHNLPLAQSHLHIFKQIIKTFFPILLEEKRWIINQYHKILEQKELRTITTLSAKTSILGLSWNNEIVTLKENRIQWHPYHRFKDEPLIADIFSDPFQTNTIFSQNKYLASKLLQQNILKNLHRSLKLHPLERKDHNDLSKALPSMYDILQSLEKNGQNILITGGALRDAIRYCYDPQSQCLLEPASDFDLVTTGSMPEIEKILHDNFPILKNYLNFSYTYYLGTLSIGDLDISRIRTYGMYQDKVSLEDGRKVWPIAFVGNVEKDALKKDALSRDFCCNANYFSLKENVIIDPTGYGVQDSIAKTLRQPCDNYILSNKKYFLRYLKMRAAQYIPCSTTDLTEKMYINAKIFIKLYAQQDKKQLKKMIFKNENPCLNAEENLMALMREDGLEDFIPDLF